MKDIIAQLIEEHQRHWKIIHKMEDMGITLPEPLKVDLLEIILDMLGVPKDTTMTAKKDTAEYYCRDHFWMDWHNDIDAFEFMEYVENNVKEYRKEIANGTV